LFVKSSANVVFAALTMLVVSAPASRFHPISTSSVYSVSSRATTQGTPKKQASFYTPPESVRSRRAALSKAIISM